MDAHVYLDRDGSWMISLRCAGLEVDEAGPFDDEADALLASERMIFDGGNVFA